MMIFPTFTPNESLSQYNFTQYFNPSKMKKIIESGYNVEYDEEWLRVNEIKDFNDAQTHIKKIYRTSRNGILHASFMTKDYGRYFYKGSVSIGLLICPFRHSICREDYVDFDMINAHFKILEQLCILHKIPQEHYKYISQYCKKRDSIRQKLCKQYFPNEEYSTVKDKIKTLFLRIMYLGSFEKWKKDNGLPAEMTQDAHTSKITDNIILLLNRIKQDNITEWNDVKKNVEKDNKKKEKLAEKHNTKYKPKNPDASFLSLFLQSWERKVCETAIVYMNNNNLIKDNVLVYTFDGFMILKRDDDTSQICKDLNEYIKERLHLDIGWETKDFDRHIDEAVFPQKIDYDFPEDRLVHYDFKYFDEINTYEEKRGYFEKFISKTINPQPIYHFRFTDHNGNSQYVMYNKDHLKEAFMEYTLYEQKQSNNKGNVPDILFIEKWLTDTDKSLYQKADFRPYANNPKEQEDNKLILNTFTGYNPVCFDDTLDADENYIKPFLEIVKNIVGGDEDDVKAFHHIMAWKIQKPHIKKPYSILIKSQEGEGKNTIFDTFGRLINLTHYYLTSNADDIFGDHAEGVNSKLLIVLNEMNIKQTGKYSDKFKSLITEDTYNINPKNIRPLTVRNLALIVVLSNQEYPIYIDETKRDRRWFIFQGNQKNIGLSNEVWTKIHERIREPTFIKSLYQYYMNYDLQAFNLNDAKLRNSRRKAYKSVVCRYVKPEILFLQDYIMERRFIGDTGDGQDHQNPINMEHFNNYSSASCQFRQKHYWKGFETNQTKKLNNDIDFPDKVVCYSDGFGDTMDWYNDGLFLSSKYQFKAENLRKDYHKWVQLNHFNIERNERSQKAFNNTIPTLNLPIEIVSMKDGKKGFIFTPYDILKSMINRNYMEIEKEHITEMDEAYKKYKTKTEDKNDDYIDINQSMLNLF